MTDKPPPARLVPDDLIPAATLISCKRGDSYGGYDSFQQGRGPLCYGNAAAQEVEMYRRAKHYANLAAAYGDLANWLSDLAEAEVSS